MTTNPAAPAHLLVLAMTPDERVALRDVLSHELGDDTGLEPSTAAVVTRLEAALADALTLPPNPSSPLPEQDLLHLPRAGRWASGPGCATATTTLTAATARGVSARTAWAEAAGAVAVELAVAVVEGATVGRVRALARVVVACRTEAEGAGAGDHGTSPRT